MVRVSILVLFLIIEEIFSAFHQSKVFPVFVIYGLYYAEVWAPKSLQMVIAAMKLRHLLLGRKVMTNLNSILKSRDITLPTKVCLVKAMVFLVVMYGCESWTVKKAER